MQTVRFVVDSPADAAPIVYTMNRAAEVCEIRITCTGNAVGAFNVTVRNGADTIATIASTGALGEVDAATVLTPAYINIAAGGTLTLQTSTAGAVCIATIYTLPGVTATT
jgi:hypothetical protein